MNKIFQSTAYCLPFRRKDLGIVILLHQNWICKINIHFRPLALLISLEHESTSSFLFCILNLCFNVSVYINLFSC